MKPVMRWPATTFERAASSDPTADAGDDSAPRAEVLYEFGDARIFGEQGRAFGAPWNEDAHIVLGPGVRNRALDARPLMLAIVVALAVAFVMRETYPK